MSREDIYYRLVANQTVYSSILEEKVVLYRKGERLPVVFSYDGLSKALLDGYVEEFVGTGLVERYKFPELFDVVKVTTRIEEELIYFV